MEGLKTLSIEEMLWEIKRQKSWKESYRLSDPSHSGIETAQRIIDKLQSELERRGIKCHS